MKAFSPMVSTVVILALIITSTFVAINSINTMMKKGKETSAFETGKSALLAIDKAIKELLYEAPGARRTVTISISEGKFIVSGEEDKIKFEIYPEVKILEPGTSLKEGNIKITYGPTIEAYEADIDNDGIEEYVVENSAVQLGIRKMYSPSSPGFINLSDNSTKLVKIKNKITNTMIFPTFEISIGDDPATSYGYGYTQLLERGKNLQEGVIKLHLFCPDTENNLSYDVFFYLFPGQDFIHVNVKTT